MTERIAKVIDVWVAWTNTDLTEGRGAERPLAVCLSATTANRLGKGMYVQGSDCRVTKEIAVELEGRTRRLLGPVEVHEPSDEDRDLDRRIAAKQAAVQKAAEYFSDEEMNALMDNV